MSAVHDADDVGYRKQIRSWILYDWANSAFVTTIVAAVLPVYYSTVAGASFPSAARATQAFSLTTSIALIVTAIISPLLGAYSDIAATKKRMLALFMGLGATVTGLMVLVDEGDWLLASILFVFGRLGFGAANVLYDALLPHVARPVDQDRVSAQGYALGYAGGGLLLAANVAMILMLPDGNLGVKLSFASVAVWWVVFSLPLLRNVSEPPPVGERPAGGTIRAIFTQVREMIADLRNYVHLRRFLISYLVYNDAINVVIGVAALYGAELGFGSTELLLAILLVQFSGVPYSLAFGRLPAGTGRRHARITAFIVLNIVLLPIVGLSARFLLPADVAGRAEAPYEATATRAGQGEVATTAPVVTGGQATFETIDGELVGREGEVRVIQSSTAPIGLHYVGRDVVVEYVTSPEHGVFEIHVDGVPIDEDGQPAAGDEVWRIDASSPTVRYGEEIRVTVRNAGEHVLAVVPVPHVPSEHGGTIAAVSGFEVMPPPRDSSLPTVLGLILLLQVVIAGAAFVVGPGAFGAFADRLDTRGGILVALSAYLVVAVWGFVLDTVIEFWMLAWLVSVVQGGSQALSRSLYASMLPADRSGEFFGLFSILSKFASFISPLFFVVSVALFESSRPAVLALGGMFTLGILLLRRVDVPAGKVEASQ